MAEYQTKKSSKVWVLYVLIILGGLSVITWNALQCDDGDLMATDLFEIRDHGSIRSDTGFEGYVDVMVKEPLAELSITLDFINNQGDVLRSQTVTRHNLKADTNYRFTYDHVFLLVSHATNVSDYHYREVWWRCLIR